MNNKIYIWTEDKVSVLLHLQLVQRRAIGRTVLAVIIVVIIIIGGTAGYFALRSSSSSTTTSTSTTSSASLYTSSSSSSSGSSVLDVSVVQPFGTLDPAVGNDYTQFLANINMYDNLLTQAPNGSAIPHVATKWSISSNGLVYTFELTQGIKFHNGDVMNSTDVVFSMQRELAVEQGFSSLWLPVLSASGVKALNSSAVQFTLNTVYAPFLGSLSLFFIVDKNLVMQHLTNVTASNPMGDWGVGWLTDADAGSGPYILQHWTVDTELTLTRYAGYWEGWAKNPNPYQTVNYEYISSDATDLSLAQSGQLQWVSTFLAIPTYQSLQSMGWTWNTFPSSNIFDLKMNTQCGCAFTNLDFRKAVSYAFNYSAIPSILPGAIQSDGPLANNYAYHDQVFQYSYNPTQAKAMLAASGINPSTTTITLTYVSGNIPEEQMGALFQTDMQNVLGVTVDLNPQTFQTMTQLAASASTTPQISEVYYDPLYPDADSFFYPIYATNASGTWESMEWLNNATINSLIAQERSSTSASQRATIFDELQNDIVALAPDVFVFNQPYYVGLAPTVKGYTFYTGMSFDYSAYQIENLANLAAAPVGGGVPSLAPAIHWTASRLPSSAFR